MNRKPTPQLKPKELELISAYLDGQLTESQMEQVRRRLTQDPVFSQAYRDLRATRMALRSAPQIKRRRSFTLTPDMVSRPVRGWNMQRVSSMMAVAATVLLAVVFAGDMFFGRGGTQFAMMDEMNYAAESVMEDAAEMDAISAEPSEGEAAEAPLAEAPQAEMLEEPAAEEAAPAEAPAELAVETEADAPAEQVAEEPEDADDAAAGNQGFAAQTAQPAVTPAPEGTQAPDQSRAAPMDEAVVEGGIGSAESAKTVVSDGEGVEEVQPYIEPESGLPAPTFFEKLAGYPLIRLVELGLLALAIVSGAVALVLKRRR
jgi:hypothetical protein